MIAIEKQLGRDALLKNIRNSAARLSHDDLVEVFMALVDKKTNQSLFGIASALFEFYWQPCEWPGRQELSSACPGNDVEHKTALVSTRTILARCDRDFVIALAAELREMPDEQRPSQPGQVKRRPG